VSARKKECKKKEQIISNTSSGQFYVRKSTKIYFLSKSANNFEIVKSFKTLGITLESPLAMNDFFHLIQYKNTNARETSFQIKI